MPAENICAAVSLTSEAQRVDGQTLLRVIITGQVDVRLTHFAILAFDAADDSTDARMTLVAAHQKTPADGPVRWIDSGLFFVSDPNLPVGEEGIVVTAVYRRSGNDLRLASSFRLRYLVGKVPCAWSGRIGSPGTDDAGRIVIVVPQQDGMPLSRDETGLEARLILPTPTGEPPAPATSTAETQDNPIVMVDFVINDDSGSTRWRWSEYTPRYCAFGYDEHCAIAPERWWNHLPAGYYTLNVTVSFKDGRIATTTRTFVKLTR
jgi:hypothetical protein